MAGQWISARLKTSRTFISGISPAAGVESTMIAIARLVGSVDIGKWPDRCQVPKGSICVVDCAWARRECFLDEFGHDNTPVGS